VPVRLLGLFAHPLDGSLLCGGTFARYACAGVETAIACAADSEPPHALEAARALGVRHLFLLGFDGGELARLPAAALSAILADVIRGVAPQVVVTASAELGGPGGAALSQAASRAFLGLWHRSGGAGRPPVRLYQALTPQRQALALMPLLPHASTASPSLSLDPPAVLDSAVTAILDVRAQTEAKLAAVRALTGRPVRSIDPADLDAIGHEFFRRAYPQPWVSGVLERELLGGLADRRDPSAPGLRLAG